MENKDSDFIIGVISGFIGSWLGFLLFHLLMK